MLVFTASHHNLISQPARQMTFDLTRGSFVTILDDCLVLFLIRSTL